MPEAGYRKTDNTWSDKYFGNFSCLHGEFVSYNQGYQKLDIVLVLAGIEVFSSQ